MSEPKRVLIVDDDPAITTVWSTILTNEGFKAEVASSVPEALVRITAEQFDVLISDLNIGQPGDGFTVVSAMRRVQPEAVTLILTGYPAFQAALRAIHQQVDDFLTKPADPEQLIKSVRDNLSRRKKSVPILARRLAEIIADHKLDIIEEWYRAVETDPDMQTIPLSRDERIDHLPELIDEIVRTQTAASRDVVGHAKDAAAKHGIQRRQQGYSVAMLLEETRLLHRVIAQCAQQNLLKIDVSNLVPDLVEVNDTIHVMLRHSTDAFLQRYSKIA
jgi:DNA-binding response OmpR family regulator